MLPTRCARTAMTSVFHSTRISIIIRTFADTMILHVWNFLWNSKYDIFFIFFFIRLQLMLELFSHDCLEWKFFKISSPGASLGALSGGRVGIMNISLAYFVKAIAIAVRYSAVRKQFGPTNDELPVIEYQLQVTIPRQDKFTAYLHVLFSGQLMESRSSRKRSQLQFKFLIQERLGGVGWG